MSFSISSTFSFLLLISSPLSSFLTANFSLSSSVQLARRVLQLEKTNSGLRDQLRWEGEKVCRLQEDLECSRELLRCSEQPGGYLLERVKEQQAQLQQSREKLNRVEQEMAALVEEKAALVDTKNKMSADLERLLSHREVSMCAVCVCVRACMIGRSLVVANYLTLLWSVIWQELQYMKTLLLGGGSGMLPASQPPDYVNRESTTLECQVQLSNSTHPCPSKTSHKSRPSHRTHTPSSPSHQPHPTVFVSLLRIMFSKNTNNLWPQLQYTKQWSLWFQHMPDMATLH